MLTIILLACGQPEPPPRQQGPDLILEGRNINETLPQSKDGWGKEELGVFDPCPIAELRESSLYQQEYREDFWKYEWREPKSFNIRVRPEPHGGCSLLLQARR